MVSSEHDATREVSFNPRSKSESGARNPEGFAFFVSLHHFVEFIEATPDFAVFFIAAKKKGSRSSEISSKYSILKEVYQGIKDIDIHTTADLGHDRYVAIRELGLFGRTNFRTITRFGSAANFCAS